MGWQIERDRELKPEKKRAAEMDRWRIEVRQWIRWLEGDSPAIRQRAESVYWENIRGVLGGNTSSQAILLQLCYKLLSAQTDKKGRKRMRKKGKLPASPNLLGFVIRMWDWGDLLIEYNVQKSFLFCSSGKVHPKFADYIFIFAEVNVSCTYLCKTHYDARAWLSGKCCMGVLGDC